MGLGILRLLLPCCVALLLRCQAPLEPPVELPGPVLAALV
jgi:hypothetical protein